MKRMIGLCSVVCILVGCGSPDPTVEPTSDNEQNSSVDLHRIDAGFDSGFDAGNDTGSANDTGTLVDVGVDAPAVDSGVCQWPKPSPRCGTTEICQYVVSAYQYNKCSTPSQCVYYRRDCQYWLTYPINVGGCGVGVDCSAYMNLCPTCP